MKGQDVAMYIEVSIGVKMAQTKYSNLIMEKKKNEARIAINFGYSTQLVPRCLSGELPPQT